jgi:hypothetical protein
MRQTKKGNVRFFGMKVHVGTDKQGLAHRPHLSSTPADGLSAPC